MLLNRIQIDLGQSVLTRRTGESKDQFLDQQLSKVK